ncbi:hypothetical protein [Bradyrhizobium lablabi]|uniref:hypothetical protein n=1 Tax=Bradyrhizobium lablabi TaxID=722472 RepID=UPI00090C4CBE|nr:hypothetical protein [Bradyrhizobium lablabi]SHM40776.1 hypothetical protein SAMN05444321_6242 [Bradyrhizobium lablabi]
MAAPFGGHPNLATYIVWLKSEHQGLVQSGYSTDGKGKSHALTKLSVPSGASVVVVGMSQAEFLVPTMVSYLDRRLGVKSPWFSI